ncbi:MAG TPA: hypothetical protein VFZ49_01985 [Pyrinomonadaceae bacterium]
MVETFALLVSVIFLVLVGSHDIAQFFLKDPETRRFWLKWWIVIAIVFGVAIWGILLITGK